MKKLLLLGLCLSTAVVAFAAGGGVSNQAVASISATAPLKVAPGQTEEDALYQYLKSNDMPIPAWLGEILFPERGEGSANRNGGETYASATPITFTAGGTYSDAGTTVGAVNDYDFGTTASICNYGLYTSSFAAGDVVYSFTLPAYYTVSASTCNNASYDSCIGIVNSSGTVVAADDDGTGCAGYSSNVEACCLPPGTYYIVVDGYSSLDSGTFTLTVNFGASPCVVTSPCDTYSTTNLGDISAADYSGTFTTVGAPDVNGVTGPDIGFNFTVSVAGDYVFSSCNATTTYDSDFYLYSASPCPGPSGAYLQYVDGTGSCSGGNTWSAFATWTLAPGSYHLVVTGFSGTSGVGQLNISAGVPCTPYDCTGLPTEDEAPYTRYDVTNGGCNSTPPVYSPLECGDDWCGTFFTFVNDSTGFGQRDMDWYEFTVLENKPVTANTFSCANYSLFVIGADCTTQYGYVTGTDNLSLTTPCLPVGTYYFVIAPSAFDNVPMETGYHATFSCGTVCDMAPVITATCIGDQEAAGPWTATATITDDFGVTAANLWYNVDYGTYTSVPMTPMGGGVYSAAIPNQVGGSYVGYYIEALDGTNTSTYGTCYFSVVDITWAPQTLVASDGLYGGVNLTWSYPAAPVTLEELIASGLSKEEALARVNADRSFLGYNVYRDGGLVGTTFSLSYVDIPPAFVTVYNYHVTASYSSGESAVSNSDTGFMLAPPTSGGPDAFGYRWMNSDDPSGQVSYSYTDISATGTLVTLSDDNFVGPFALGIPFSFYGVAQTDAYIGSNGVVSFGAGVSSLGNTALPDGFTPNNLIAAFWDDLGPHYVGSAVYYLSDVANGRFIVQYHVPHYGSVEPYTFLDFQVVLYADNTIRVNFLNLVEGDVAQATNGIENADGTVGLQVNFNGSGGRLGDLLSVRFSPVQPCDATDLVVVTMAAGNANLDWNAMGGATSYKIYGSADGYGPFTLLGTSVDSAYVDSGAQAAGRKFYQIVSVCE